MQNLVIIAIADSRTEVIEQLPKLKDILISRAGPEPH